ncbi:MmgE/PrpD family protein [Chelativorans sp. AA-79]|uniref:MmgE/PrpD family protein n=1 Tax=Chelativorans sp. AA-79 TaxID=3028735 RepID=UPI0023F96019|nr:MmgE/PrpD family protein [Chelativorans sp. AA-79]WEX10654.1 MmgE/PrpD family protein [Chelativorans sp. AA-79]
MPQTEQALLREIAQRFLRISVDTCPEEAVETAKLAILDTLGVTLAGSGSLSAVALVKAIGRTFGEGPALLFGGSRRVDVLSAALANGTASHALDFDDCSNTMGGHPSAPIVPALWALAEERGASGASFIASYIAGFEVETKLGRAVNFHHYEKGWHPTATLGTFGSAAACCHLLDLDADRSATALALAASMASGLKANFGTMTKPFHIGHCACNGLQAALLAEAGMTANHDVLEHPQGFFAVYNGAGTFVPERLFENWAAPLDIIEPGVAFKRHPCCASTHPAIDALLQLREVHGLHPDNVASILSWTHPRRLRHTNRPDPKDGLDGKFSVQYVLARALRNGLVGVDDFSDEAVRDPEIRSIMSRIEAAPHPQAVMESTEHFFAELRVTTTSGEVLTAHVDRPLGRDRDHPLPPGTLERKFADCAGQVVEPDVARQFAARIFALEAERDIRSLSRQLSVPSRPDAGAARVA